MSKVTSKMNSYTQLNQYPDQKRLRRRSSLYKPTLEDDEYLKNTLDAFLSSQRDRELVVSDTPITWERLSKGYRIVDFEIERAGESLEFLKKFYFFSNSKCQTSSLYVDSHTIRKYQDFILKVVSERNSVCALEEGTKQIVGVAIAKMNYKKKETWTVDEPVISSDVFNVLKLEANLRSQANAYKCFKVDRYFCIYLVCVKPDLYGDGIGTSLIRACLSKAQNAQSPACIGIFPAGAAYTIAQRFDLNVLSEVPWMIVDESNPDALIDSYVICMGTVLPVKKVVGPLTSDSVIKKANA